VPLKPRQNWAAARPNRHPARSTVSNCSDYGECSHCLACNDFSDFPGFRFSVFIQIDDIAGEPVISDRRDALLRAASPIGNPPFPPISILMDDERV